MVARDGRGVPINLSPLLDLVAEHIEELLAQLSPAERKRFDRSRKLSDAQVRQIRASTDKIICIAAEHHVSISTVSQIRTGKRYLFVK